MVNRKWSRHVHLKEGALKGWCSRCPAARRRQALRSVARSDGYAVAIRRLNFLKNVANRRDNAGLRTAAGRDIVWAERVLGKKKQSE